MQETTTKDAQVVQFRLDIRRLLQTRLREAVELVLEEELSSALGAPRYERLEGRLGYRNGVEERSITTGTGTRKVRVPRGRVVAKDGATEEFRSELLPRYARRTEEVDSAILSCYLAGANSRRIRKALEPLLGEEHLSKSAVSRVVVRLKKLFESWQQRDLSQERYGVLFLDGFHLKVRMARRVVSVPVLAVLGVRQDGEKVLVGLRLAPSEAAANWSEVIVDLQKRGLTAPLLLVVDGNAGLNKALAAWPEAKVQRCTVHKLRNLQDHCPAHARREMKRDYDRIIHAKDGLTARGVYEAFTRKWSALCPAVTRSLEEAGTELLTFYEFPKSMWKSLRSTNALENLNREFRRRTKTQGSFGTEDAALKLLYGLVAFGQIEMRKIVGHRDLTALMMASTQAA
jgi:transposase-like protein